MASSADGLDNPAPPGMSLPTAAIFIFNLIVGTGALALPAAFLSAGWLVASVLLLVLALTSYITATWVIECIAACNGIISVEESCRIHQVNQDLDDDKDDKNRVDSDGDTDEDDRTYLVKNDLNGQVDGANYGSTENHLREELSVCNFGQPLELAAMADLLFNKTGKLLFCLCMVLYLYGDLAIYCAAVAKSLRDVTCTIHPDVNCSLPNTTMDSTIGPVGWHDSEVALCWPGSQMSRHNVYRLYVGLFVCLLGPFTFFNVSKTKYLQMFTTVMRWTAFTAMIGLAIARILNRGVEHGSPPSYSLTSIPAVFGVSVYAFMCHHSIPSLISPVKSKENLGLTLFMVYTCIALFYLLLSITGIFAFPSIPDLYTLAFKPNRCAHTIGFTDLLAYYLELFPVFTLSTNFPIIGITLRNNLASMLAPIRWLKQLQTAKYRNAIFALLEPSCRV